jgi:hypothetical protein
MSCIRTSQPIAVQPIAEADAPTFPHGETAENPIPIPKASNANDNAAVANAPAMTAAHVIPDECASFLLDASEEGACERMADEETSITIASMPPRRNYLRNCR